VTDLERFAEIVPSRSSAVSLHPRAFSRGQNGAIYCQPTQLCAKVAKNNNSAIRENTVMDLQYTLFEYLYRDASNDKSWGQLLVAGSAFPQDIDALKDCLENGSLFIAELVGIPPLSGERWTVSSGSGEDDYDFHEFVGMRPATVDEILALRLFGDLDGLLRKFEQASQHWDSTGSLSVANS